MDFFNACADLINGLIGLFLVHDTIFSAMFALTMCVSGCWLLLNLFRMR